MRCPYIKHLDCHKGLAAKDLSISTCSDCRNYLADELIRKWTTQGARNKAMENDFIKKLIINKPKKL